mgnify:CR=1 FL=1
MAGLAWFTAYWIPVAGLLMLLAILVWVRGVDTSLGVRRLNTALRFQGGLRTALVVLVAAFAAGQPPLVQSLQA